MADIIDVSKLPRSALIDSSVVIPAFGSRARATDDPACKPFCEAMIKNGRLLLIAAPSLTEFLRGGVKSALPRTRSVQIVAFDERSAELLATKFPQSILVRLRDKRKRALQYIKYDALIAACALRHRAEALVSCDGLQRDMAQASGLLAMKPSDFWAKQTKLPGVS